MRARLEAHRRFRRPPRPSRARSESPPSAPQPARRAPSPAPGASRASHLASLLTLATPHVQLGRGPSSWPSVQRGLSCAERPRGAQGRMPPPQRWQGPGALPREPPGSVRCLDGPCRAGPGTCAVRAPPRPSAQATQDPSAPTRSGGNGGAPAPADPCLWPPSAGASAAPDHPLRGWPLQGPVRAGEDRAVGRKTVERSGAVTRRAVKPARRVVRRHGKDVGADGGGVNPPVGRRPAGSRVERGLPLQARGASSEAGLG